MDLFLLLLLSLWAVLVELSAAPAAIRSWCVALLAHFKYLVIKSGPGFGVEQAGRELRLWHWEGNGLQLLAALIKSRTSSP